MTKFEQITKTVHDSHAMGQISLQAIRESSHGLGVQVKTIEQTACLLAAGFIRTIDRESLNDAILKVPPDTPMGELEPIKGLLGIVEAATSTLCKVWRSELNIMEYAEKNFVNPVDELQLEAISSFA